MCFAAIFPPLRNSVTPLLIALESYSNPRNIWQVFKPTIKKEFFGLGFIMSDVISGIGFWPFWLRLPGLGPYW